MCQQQQYRFYRHFSGQNFFCFCLHTSYSTWYTSLLVLIHPLKIQIYGTFQGKSAMLWENIPRLIHKNITNHTYSLGNGALLLERKAASAWGWPCVSVQMHRAASIRYVMLTVNSRIVGPQSITSIFGKYVNLWITLTVVTNLYIICIFTHSIAPLQLFLN